jgi:hypothetical protein
LRRGRKIRRRSERDKVVSTMVGRRERLCDMDPVDRARGAQLRIEETRWNLEGVEVALQMREQRIAMQRQFNELFRLLDRDLKKGNDS